MRPHHFLSRQYKAVSTFSTRSTVLILSLSQPIESVSAHSNHRYGIVFNARHQGPGPGGNLVRRFEHGPSDARVPPKDNARAGPRDVQLGGGARGVVKSGRGRGGKPVEGIIAIGGSDQPLQR